ncbi:MAG: SDR family NAD(P)-dependent oxidoreductase [Arenicella sp.]
MSETPIRTEQVPKVIIISGGSRGLGIELVKRSLAQGWSVATFSRSTSQELEQLLDNQQYSSRLFWQSVDGSDSSQLKQFAATVFKQFGRIDGLVNNMGIGSDGLLALMREQDIDNCLDLNLRSAIYLTQACSRLMLQQQSGSVVNISSVNAIRGHAGVAVYSATKAALEGLAKSLARELGPKSIRVNTVAPGYFESDMVGELTETQKNRIARRTPLGRLARIDEIAAAVLFLLSDNASFITGQLIAVDGGITC